MRYLLTILCFITLQASGQALFHAHNRASSGPGTPTVCTVSDADAQKFVTAAQISDCTVAAVANYIVTAAKDSGVWTAQTAVYPMLSDGVLKSRAEQHRYNLKDTAAHKIAWGGMATHSATGVHFTGIAGDWGNMNLIPSSVMTLNNTHLSYYSRDNTLEQAIEIGAVDGSGTIEFYLYWNGLGQGSRLYDGSGGQLFYNRTGGSAGFALNSRTSATDHRLFWNGAQVGSTSTSSGGGLPGVSLYLGARNASGGNYQSTKECAFASVGTGLTPEQARAWSNIVNTAQAMLSRNVY